MYSVLKSFMSMARFVMFWLACGCTCCTYSFNQNLHGQQSLHGLFGGQVVKVLDYRPRGPRFQPHSGLARPVRQVRFWPYHFLVTLRLVGVGYTVGGGVAPTWWRSIDVNVVHACSSKRPAAHVLLSWNFLTSCLQDSFFHSEPLV